MEIGIYGLPYSGKSVLFDLLTGLHDSGDKSKTRVGTCVVPDARLQQLVDWYKSKKTTAVHIELSDPGLAHSEKPDESLSNARLNPVRHIETIVLVARCFELDSVPHPEKSVDPVRDLDLLLTQFVLADMEVIERRLTRVDDALRRLPKDQKEPYEIEKDILLRVRTTLESDKPWETTELTDPERKRILNYSLFHLKKFVVLGNLGDCSKPFDANAWKKLQESAAEHLMPCVGVNVQLELELKDMSPDEAKEFRDSMVLDAESCDDLLKSLYDQLGLTTFYTAGEKESAARPVPKGTLAPQASGTIHSDMERGFIRLEVFSYEDLKAAGGSEVKVKQSGAFRLEGKEYVVQDGDIVIVRFSA